MLHKHHTTTPITAPIAPVAPSRAPLTPLGIDEFTLEGGFWGTLQETNRAHILGHVKHWLEREGWIRNFDLAAAGTLPAGRRGREFSDSEVYKYLEAVAWELGCRSDPALEEDFTQTVARIAAAQETDGYLNTRFGRPGQGERWSDLAWGHELYCLGHLFQAAVARGRTAPEVEAASDRGLLAIAVRAADLVCSEFGADGRDAVCGHAEIETALVELGRLTGEDRYMEQARIFVERRGRGTLPEIEFGSAYFQDDLPVREAEVLRGHAVRANYLSSGAADVADETGDADLLAVLARQWDTTVARRTYLTGGQGSHHQDEAFGEDFELPPDRAYSETCAGIASIQFSWRLLLGQGLREDCGDGTGLAAARYADLIERTLYNVVATSPSAEGTGFYYANTLHQRVPGRPADPDTPSARALSSLRAPWFEVSCCPPNVARTLASLGSYVASKDETGIQLHQFVGGTLRTDLAGPGADADAGAGAGAGAVALRIETSYPDDGTVTVHIEQSPAEPWTLSVRVPAWADGAQVRVESAPGGSSPREAQHGTAPGYAEVTRSFSAGDRVILDLPLDVRVTRPDARIDAVRGCVAIERGPVVHALESVDLPGGADVADVELDLDWAPRSRGHAVMARVRAPKHSDEAWPYAEIPGPEGPGAAAPSDAAPSDAIPATASPSAEVRLIPYHAWAERGPSTMRVWIPTTR
jgi:DUF1680 family protein